MSRRDDIYTLLRRRVLILDGAMGTELHRRGMPAGACPELWCLENPAVAAEIHGAYRQAGADIVYTFTFGANRPKLEQFGLRNVESVNRDLALLARHASGDRSLIAGDIGSTGRFVEPFGDLDFDEAVGLFKEQVRGLLAGGVDLFVIETMMDIQEARAALLAVREITDRFVIVTMTYERDGRTLNGTDPLAALVTLQSLGADAVGCNCSVGPETMVDWIAAMKPFATVPLVAKPNAGLPRLFGSETVFDMNAETFASFGRPFVEAGVNLLGGCCGTAPDHIAALKRTLTGARSSPPRQKSLAALSSASDALFLDRDKPLLVVGERINPTGKKELQAALKEGKFAPVRQLAKDQERQGADLLDVNAGMPGIDEAATLRQIVLSLATVTRLPLVIDSARVEAVEAALRIYPGRALVNSISGEREKLEKLVPLAAKYGAMFILLPLRDGEIPQKAAERRTVIKEVIERAKAFGFTRNDIVVDGLVMTVAASPEAAVETLKTVAWCNDRLKCRTVLGLSNVSFGMPERKWINAAFLAMAQAGGLTLAIANPGSGEVMHLKMAGDVLTAKDPKAARYIAHFLESTPGKKAAALPSALSPLEKVAEAVLEGERETIVESVETALAAGADPARLVEETLIPAIVKVGALYERGVYFLPQLIAGAEAMQKALEHLEPLLLKGGLAADKRGVIVLATVKGDIHDIGKNIVALILRNHGYRIVDLGKDVAAPAVVEAARHHRADVVGLSALMTTTMVKMKEVIDLARREGLACPFILGGAVVTPAYAESLGAAYAKDGVEAVGILDSLLRRDRAAAEILET
ncbi:MAG: homocysteine S-methyltransferase family protein [Deltaproteobacteria bacterium]|nr:homocysteine S-methyltransferase family protein [Deltaproteobacteria bacterium]